MAIKLFTALVALLATANASPAYIVNDSPVVVCTTGSPVVTAGYTINYAPATPTAKLISDSGYQPDASWGIQHMAATYVSFPWMTHPRLP